MGTITEPMILVLVDVRDCLVADAAAVRVAAVGAVIARVGGAVV